MHSPCAIRRAVKVAMSGAVVSRLVGIAKSARLATMPVRRSIRRLKKATASPASAMPIVLALTARLIAAGITP